MKTFNLGDLFELTDDAGERIQAHPDAGADHVCIQPLSPANPFAADLEALDALAPAKVTS